MSGGLWHHHGKPHDDLPGWLKVLELDDPMEVSDQLFTRYLQGDFPDDFMISIDILCFF